MVAILLKKKGIFCGVKVDILSKKSKKMKEHKKRKKRLEQLTNHIGTIDSITSGKVLVGEFCPLHEAHNVKEEKDINHSKNIPPKPSLKVIGAMEFSEIEKEKGPLTQLKI